MTARKAYLRASEYWRQSFFFIRHDIGDERVQHAWRRHRKAFRAAMLLLGCHAVATEIPFDGVSMTGYLFRPAADGTRRQRCWRPADSTRRPRQATPRPATWRLRAATTSSCSRARPGGTLFEHRRAFRPDFEVPFGAAFEWLLAQEGVDPDAVAVIGRRSAVISARVPPRSNRRWPLWSPTREQYDFASRVGVMAKELSAANPDDFLAKLMRRPRSRHPNFKRSLPVHAMSSGTARGWRRWARPGW